MATRIKRMDADFQLNIRVYLRDIRVYLRLF
jgi:hypothetical protein